MSDTEHGNLAALQVEIRTLCENVARLSAVVEQNTFQLGKLAVLEEKHNNQSQALNRAFEAVEQMEERMEEHRKDDVVTHAELSADTRAVKDTNDKDHKAYDKAIYLAIGVVMAVSVFWTIFGVRINNTIENLLSTTVEMQVYMKTHKSGAP